MGLGGKRGAWLHRECDLGYLQSLDFSFFICKNEGIGLGIAKDLSSLEESPMCIEGVKDLPGIKSIEL